MVEIFVKISDEVLKAVSKRHEKFVCELYIRYMRDST